MRRRPVLSVCALSALFVAGCLSRPIDPVEPNQSPGFTASLPSAVAKIDLLLAIDNSSSMADKQAILAAAVPTLVSGLLNPSCVDASGQAVSTPSDPFSSCPANTTREFQPVVDVHVGIVTSSLGGIGACTAAKDTHVDDKGRLVARVLDGQPAVPTYKNQSFLAWQPKAAGATQDESSLPQFEADLRGLVAGVGQDGCGYEAQLESWYRFLVEPATDDPTIISERKDFLRPDSLLSIILLTDENDCSVVPNEAAGYIFAGQDSGVHPPRPTQVCKDNPDDHCCAPCTNVPQDCPADPSCSHPYLDQEGEDPIDLRCYDQKRRYGHDFLYPVQRYVDALTQLTVPGLDGKDHPNPLFAVDAAHPENRLPAAGLVYLAGIIGVPWQDIARRNAQGAPDLRAGLDAEGKAVGGFLSAKEMSAANPKWGGTTWDLILGDPTTRTPPLDPLMRESEDPRKGKNPLLDVPLAPITSGSADANPVNGHEWNAKANTAGDLQYACIFPLKQPLQCSAQGASCDCGDDYDNPLCQDATGAYQDVQFQAKAYPGVRELEVLKGLGDQGIVASICPAEFDEKQAVYGYNPAVGAIVEQLKKRLGNACLPLKLELNVDNSFPCIVLEGHETGEGCDCTADGRVKVTSTNDKVAQAEAEKASSSKFACFCKVNELKDAARTACQNDPGPAPSVNGEVIAGWCYVDPQTGQGNTSVVAACPADEKRELRILDGSSLRTKSTTFISCTE